MRKNKKNSINWLFNQPDAIVAVTALGARNITIIEAVVLHSVNKEEVLKSYDKMVMYDSEEANLKTIDWINKTIANNFTKESYIYFRFKRSN